METDAHGNYAADAQELQCDWDERHGIEPEEGEDPAGMNAADGLGAELKTVKQNERSETEVFDGNGRRLREGDEVHQPNSNQTDRANFGVIVTIGDPDGDLDDEGRPYEIPPCVEVEYHDGSDERWTAHYVYHERRYVCDEVEAI